MQEIIENFVDPNINSGTIRHRWISPETHRDEVVEIRIEIYKGKANNIRMNYGCGGWAEDTSQVQVAYAMSRAFQLAGARLEQLYKEHDFEGS